MKPYNERIGIGRPKGHKLSEESKKKISATMKGMKRSEETKAKIKETMLRYWANKTIEEEQV